MDGQNFLVAIIYIMWYNVCTGIYYLNIFFAPNMRKEVDLMSIYKARTTIISKNGVKLSYAISFDMNCHGKIKNARLISSHIPGIRPYMFLDLLSKTMPNRLYCGNTYVSFGHTQVDHPIIGKIAQPCLIVEDAKYGQTRYLINRYSDEKWLETIYSSNLAAMVTWWRENRDRFFRKPIQEWEIEKV